VLARGYADNYRSVSRTVGKPVRRAGDPPRQASAGWGSGPACYNRLRNLDDLLLNCVLHPAGLVVVSSLRTLKLVGSMSLYTKAQGQRRCPYGNGLRPTSYDFTAAGELRVQNAVNVADLIRERKVVNEWESIIGLKIAASAPEVTNSSYHGQRNYPLAIATGAPFNEPPLSSLVSYMSGRALSFPACSLNLEGRFKGCSSCIPIFHQHHIRTKLRRTYPPRPHS